MTPRTAESGADRLLPLVPALLLALFAGYAGTFVGAASASGAILGHLALGLLLLAFAGWAASADPLGLGPTGRYLAFALALSVLASLFASPVPRAGRLGVPVALAIVLLAPVLARGFSAHRSRAVLLVAVVVGGVAAYALAAWLAGSSTRPALPLGHHGLLAGWLAMLLPLAALPAAGDPGEHPARWRRGVGAGAVLLGLAALLAARSAAGLLAVAAEAGVAALWGGERRRRRALGLAALALGLALVPRAFSILGGQDPSAAARRVYWQAGLSGWAERPLLGWGPGSTPWTLSPHLAPVPGANPPGEAVGDLHSLPLTLGYELGGTGLLLALGMAFAFGRARLREERTAPDPLRRAGLLGLLGGAIAALGSGAWSVPALPVAALVATGAALAPTLGRALSPGRRAGGLVRAAALALLLLLAPLDAAHQSYDQAIGTDRTASIAALDSALAADPAFSLYRARRAAYRARDPRLDAEEALAAARAAGDVPPLWLLAGELAVEARRPGSGEALDRACRAAPFDGLAPWLRLKAEPPPEDPVSIAARALLAEPLLLWAVEGPGHGREVRRAAVERIERLSGVEAGWRRALVLAATEAAASRRTAGEPSSFLTFGMESPEGSFSLHWFRRRPWGSYLGGVALGPGAAEAPKIPAATRLPTTSSELFASSDCRLKGPLSTAETARP